MASLESKILTTLLKLSGIKTSINRRFNNGHFHQGDMNRPYKQLTASLNIVTTQVSGRNVFTLSPKNDGNETKILYLHGGAYIRGFGRIHWDFFNTLIKKTGCTVIAPDYPLAPESNYKDSFEMLTQIYEDLILNDKPENLILMGDSSGGGFALAFAQKMLTENKPMPRRIILLSPWLDVTMENPELRTIEPLDPVLEISGLIRAGKAYAAQTDPHDPLLSPIYGNLEGLPRISLFAGTRDILVADARRLKKIADEKGISIDYVEVEDMVHVWMLLYIKESKQAIEQITQLILES